MSSRNLSHWILKINQTFLEPLSLILIATSTLIFPFSSSLSFLVFSSFIVARIVSIILLDLNRRKNQLLFVILIVLVIKLFQDIFFVEDFQSSIIFQGVYPVTIHDYLMVAIVFLSLTINPISSRIAEVFFYCLSFSPLIVFASHFQELSFTIRSNMGFKNPNWLGLYCSICIALVLCLILQILTNPKVSFHKLRLAILSVSLSITLLMLLSSGSKSAIVATLIIGLAVFILFNYHLKVLFSKYRYIKLFKFGSLSIGIASLGWLILNKNRFPIFNRFFDLQDLSNIYRVQFYQCYFSLGMEKPLLGWGIGHTAQICEERLGYTTGQVNHAHNFILQIFADNGIIITGIVIGTIVYGFLIPSWRYMVKNNRNEIPYLFPGFSLAYCAILIVSLFQSAFYHYPLFPLWLGFFWAYQNNFMAQLKSVPGSIIRD